MTAAELSKAHTVGSASGHASGAINCVIFRSLIPSARRCWRLAACATRTSSSRICPKDVVLDRPLNLPPGISEYEIVDYFRARAAENAELSVVSRRRRVPPLPSRGGGHGRFARRVPDVLHAVPGGDLAGHADHDLRIPDHDLPAHRHGRGQRVDVRRLDRRAGSGHDGGARHRTPSHSGLAHGASGISRGAAHLRAAPGTAGGGVRLRRQDRRHRSGGSGIAAEQPDRGGDHPVAEFLRHRRAGERRGGTRAQVGALLVFVFTEAVSLGLLEPPASADIVAGELQSFAISPSYGGPFAGIIAAKEKFIRQMPGRLVGPDGGHATATAPSA